MKTATITQLKNGISALIDRVRAGESILILDRGVPVARLEPVPPAPDDARLARLERAGIIRRGTGEPVPLERLAKPLRRGQKPAGVLDALLEERREGR
jgi:prevent-host-death family protein